MSLETPACKTGFVVPVLKTLQIAVKAICRWCIFIPYADKYNDFIVHSLHYFQHDKSMRQETLYENFSLKCQCEACINNFPVHHGGYKSEKIPDIPSKYNAILGTFSFVDYEVENFNNYLELLELLAILDYTKPSWIVNRMQLQVNKIMKLMYGDMSTKLIKSLKYSMPDDFSASLAANMSKILGGGRESKQ